MTCCRSRPIRKHLAAPRTKHEGDAPRAINPVNTTRTCNKLRSVYRYTAEVM